MNVAEINLLMNVNCGHSICKQLAGNTSLKSFLMAVHAKCAQHFLEV